MYNIFFQSPREFPRCRIICRKRERERESRKLQTGAFIQLFRSRAPKHAGARDAIRSLTTARSFIIPPATTSRFVVMRESDVMFSPAERPTDAESIQSITWVVQHIYVQYISAAQLPKPPRVLLRFPSDDVLERSFPGVTEQRGEKERGMVRRLERGRRRIVRLLPSDAWLGNSYNTTSLQEGFRYHAASRRLEIYCLRADRGFPDSPVCSYKWLLLIDRATVDKEKGNAAPESTWSHFHADDFRAAQVINYFAGPETLEEIYRRILMHLRVLIFRRDVVFTIFLHTYGRNAIQGDSQLEMDARLSLRRGNSLLDSVSAHGANKGKKKEKRNTIYSSASGRIFRGWNYRFHRTAARSI